MTSGRCVLFLLHPESCWPLASGCPVPLPPWPSLSSPPSRRVAIVTALAWLRPSCGRSLEPGAMNETDAFALGAAPEDCKWLYGLSQSFGEVTLYSAEPAYAFVLAHIEGCEALTWSEDDMGSATAIFQR